MAEGTDAADPLKLLMDLQQELTALRRRIDHAADAADRRQQQLPFAGPERRKIIRRASDDPQKAEPAR